MYFQPWIGANYQSGGIFSKKLLILGESHYSGTFIDKGQLEQQGYTNFIMSKWAIEKRARFYTTVARLVLRGTGKSLEMSRKMREEFWHSVAFYNFVPRFVGKASRIRPTEELWQEGIEPFFKVLDDLRPDICLVLGKQLWGKIPKPVTTEGGLKILEAGDQRILVASVHHPSSLGFSYKKWSYVVRNLFDESDTQNADGTGY